MYLVKISHIIWSTLYINKIAYGGRWKKGDVPNSDIKNSDREILSRGWVARAPFAGAAAIRSSGGWAQNDASSCVGGGEGGPAKSDSAKLWKDAAKRQSSQK